MSNLQELNDRIINLNKKLDLTNKILLVVALWHLWACGMPRKYITILLPPHKSHGPRANERTQHQHSCKEANGSSIDPVDQARGCPYNFYLFLIKNKDILNILTGLNVKF